MTRVAIYARYSSERQNSLSVADQLELGRRHAAARGWTVVAEFSDAAISGAAMANRPGLNSLLTCAEAGAFDVVLVEDTDRLARNREHDAHVWNRLVDAGVRLSTFTTERVTLVESALRGLMNELELEKISEKTKRGMRSNAEAGKATGSRLYGYRSSPGGTIDIVETEAEVIRRVFADYAAGHTSRDIAAALNREGIPGPRGGQWNASSIHGSRQRGNGILHSEIYIGVKVYGRMDVRKDRSTGKRKPKMLPPEDWKRTPVPHLRIISDEAWEAVNDRRHTVSAPTAKKHRQSLFVGLLKCGMCGANYTTYTDGKLACAAHRERGTCENRRTPMRAAIEARVLESLRDKILSPDAVARYVRTYHAAAAAEKRAQADRRAPLEKRLAEVNRGLQRFLDAIERGTATPVMEARMMELERERLAVVAELDLAQTEAQAEPVELHPGAATAYAKMIEELQATLAEFSAGHTPNQRVLIDAVRGLIDKIVITPITQDRRGPLEVTLHGTLAKFMKGREEQQQNQRSVLLVAGGGYSQTHTLPRPRLQLSLQRAA
jgi:DNA invertase Pin-like site-specific DNA recombinase